MKIIYVDTNIIMDFLLDRYRITIFTEVLNTGDILLVSDVVIKELAYQKVDCFLLFHLLEACGKLKVHNATKEDIALAYKLAHLTHFNDALHAAIAINCKADCILTRNIKDFKLLPIKAVHPDDL